MRAGCPSFDRSILESDRVAFCSSAERSDIELVLFFNELGRFTVGRVSMLNVPAAVRSAVVEEAVSSPDELSS